MRFQSNGSNFFDDIFNTVFSLLSKLSDRLDSAPSSPDSTSITLYITAVCLLIILVLVVYKIYRNTQLTNLDEIDFQYKSGKEAITKTLANLMSWRYKMQKRYKLSDTDLIVETDNPEGGVPRKIKEDVNKIREKFKNDFIDIARKEEKKNTTKIEQAAKGTEMGKFRQERLKLILKSNLDLRVSYQALIHAIKIFQGKNKDMLFEIEVLQDAKQSQNKVSHLLLTNAVFVYEISGVIRDLLEHFEPKGKQELLTLHQEILKELKVNEEKDRAFEKELEKELPEKIKNSMQESIKNRNDARNLIKEKWREFLGSIEQIEKNVDTLRSQIHNFEILRENAKIQLELLQSISATQIIHDNVMLVQQLGLIEDIPLAPLTGEQVSFLLGMKTTKALPKLPEPPGE